MPETDRQLTERAETGLQAAVIGLIRASACPERNTRREPQLDLGCSLAGAMDGEPTDMDALPEEVLKLVFRRLELYDFIRARAVCKLWLSNIIALGTAHFREENRAKSYCPLIFKRNPVQHTWCGYDSSSGSWEQLPLLLNLPQVGIRPLAGNGKTLLGFKVPTMPLHVVVGNPYTSEWQTIQRLTETYAEVGNILLTDRMDSTMYQIIEIREGETEIYQSRVGEWAKSRQRQPRGIREPTVLAMREKLISATLCRGLLFCYCETTLVSFDVEREQWTQGSIPVPPHASPRLFQLLECAGNLFAAIEDSAQSTITVWGLGLARQEFFPEVEISMPPDLYAVLCKKKRVKSPIQLKAVGHDLRMFFWRNFRNQSLSIIVFDFLTRAWGVLPNFDQAIDIGSDQPEPDETQIFVDASSFEP